MQEFLTNNTVTCNLMSLTGYRTLVIFNALMEAPKSNDEINACLLNNQYIKENFSSDTLRIYINSLREIGCEITRANKSNQKKYELLAHPFSYNIQKPQLKAISKVYKWFCEKASIEEIIEFETFFKKLSNLVSDDDCKYALRKMSLLKSTNINILNNLLTYCKNKNQITFLYNSPKSGEKEIEIIADKLSFKSDKLYLWGNNVKRKEYSFFFVDRILKICNIKMFSTKEDMEEFNTIKVVYELSSNDYILEPNEKIIEQTNDKIIIEAMCKNEFSMIQRILHSANDCKILSPETFKTKVLTKLKAMEKSYENI
jgi:hypothetical protein